MALATSAELLSNKLSTVFVLAEHSYEQLSADSIYEALTEGRIFAEALARLDHAHFKGCLIPSHGGHHNWVLKAAQLKRMYLRLTFFVRDRLGQDWSGELLLVPDFNAISNVVDKRAARQQLTLFAALIVSVGVQIGLLRTEIDTFISRLEEGRGVELEMVLKGIIPSKTGLAREGKDQVLHHLQMTSSQASFQTDHYSSQPIIKMPSYDGANVMTARDESIQNVPIQDMSVQNVPVRHLPVQNLPIQNIPNQHAPSQDVPIQDVPLSPPSEYAACPLLPPSIFPDLFNSIVLPISPPATDQYGSVEVIKIFGHLGIMVESMQEAELYVGRLVEEREGFMRQALYWQQKYEDIQFEHDLLKEKECLMAATQQEALADGQKQLQEEKSKVEALEERKISLEMELYKMLSDQEMLWLRMAQREDEVLQLANERTTIGIQLRMAEERISEQERKIERQQADIQTLECTIDKLQEDETLLQAVLAQKSEQAERIKANAREELERLEELNGSLKKQLARSIYRHDRLVERQRWKIERLAELLSVRTDQVFQVRVHRSKLAKRLRKLWKRFHAKRQVQDELSRQIYVQSQQNQALAEQLFSLEREHGVEMEESDLTIQILQDELTMIKGDEKCAELENSLALLKKEIEQDRCLEGERLEELECENITLKETLEETLKKVEELKGNQSQHERLFREETESLIEQMGGLEADLEKARRLNGDLEERMQHVEQEKVNLQEELNLHKEKMVNQMERFVAQSELQRHQLEEANSKNSKLAELTLREQAMFKTIHAHNKEKIAKLQEAIQQERERLSIEIQQEKGRLSAELQRESERLSANVQQERERLSAEVQQEKERLLIEMQQERRQLFAELQREKERLALSSTIMQDQLERETASLHERMAWEDSFRKEHMERIADLQKRNTELERQNTKVCKRAEQECATLTRQLFEYRERLEEEAMRGSALQEVQQAQRLEMQKLQSEIMTHQGTIVELNFQYEESLAHTQKELQNREANLLKMIERIDQLEEENGSLQEDMVNALQVNQAEKAALLTELKLLEERTFNERHELMLLLEVQKRELEEILSRKSQMRDAFFDCTPWIYLVDAEVQTLPSPTVDHSEMTDFEEKVEEMAIVTPVKKETRIASEALKEELDALREEHREILTVWHNLGSHIYRNAFYAR